jgi:heterotetrameric sarcosine oxidase gamma subunit
VLVRADADGNLARALGVGCGGAARDTDGTLAARFAPDEWLLFAPPGRARELVDRLHQLPDDGLVSVVDLTSGRAVLRLTGDRGPDVLAKVCAVDAASPAQGTAWRTFVAGVVTEVIRDDRTGPARRSYLLACDWSYGAYLFDVLLDAGAEFGLRAGGHLEWER